MSQAVAGQKRDERLNVKVVYTPQAQDALQELTDLTGANNPEMAFRCAIATLQQLRGEGSPKTVVMGREFYIPESVFTARLEGDADYRFSSNSAAEALGRLVMDESEFLGIKIKQDLSYQRYLEEQEGMSPDE